MNERNELLSICKLFVELTTTGSGSEDLDGLLKRMVGTLSGVTRFNIQPYAAILLKDRRNTLVQIAAFGFHAEPWDIGLQHRLAGIENQAADDAPRIAETDTALDRIPASQRFLLLPIRDDNRPLGYVCLAVGPDWQRNAEDNEFFDHLSRALSGVVTRCLTAETLRVREIELEETRTEAIRRLGTASEYRDDDTGLHVLRMAYFAAAIGRAYGLHETECEKLLLISQMHDVGKIGIADAILLKPGPLTAEEFAVMKQHTTIGQRLLSGDDEFMTAAREIAIAHHERWDGTGYPHGLRGEDIPIMARICSIADVFDALTTRRPYKHAWPTDEAVDWIREASGSRFDPRVVSAFDAALPKLVRIMTLYGDEIIDPDRSIESLASPSVQPRQRWVNWHSSLSVGIDVIDEHHRYLFDLTNTLHEAVAEKRGIRESTRVLKALTHYVQVHFRAEERLMERHGFEGLPRQQVQHVQFEEVLREFHRSLLMHPLTAPYEMLRYLRHWLVNHIRHEDSLLGQLRQRSSGST